MDNMASLSASGLLDYHKLEHLLDHLLRSSTEQQAKIAALELELANRPTKADLQAHQTAITQTVDTLTKRLTDMESRIARIEDLVPTIRQDAASVQTILAAVPALATNAGLQQMEQKVTEQLHNTIEGLMADHVSRDCFSQLETSQRRLFEELVALQNMVACKIDRVEVPLLQASADRIKELIQSREEHSKRLQEIDASLARVCVSLEQKEDKETTVLRMQKIYAMLQQKASQELTEERIVSLQRGVEEVSKQIVALSSLAELPPQVATLAHDAASARERLLVVEKAVGNAQSGVDSLAKQVCVESCAPIISFVYTLSLSLYLIVRDSYRSSTLQPVGFRKHILHCQHRRFVLWIDSVSILRVNVQSEGCLLFVFYGCRALFACFLCFFSSLCVLCTSRLAFILSACR